MFRKFMFSAIVSLLFFCSFSAVCNATRHVEQITLDDAYEILATVVEETGMMAEPVETVEGEPCYVIAVGDNKPEQFVVTGRYAVCQYTRKIFVYDVLSDSFSPVNSKK